MKGYKGFSLNIFLVLAAMLCVSIAYVPFAMSQADALGNGAATTGTATAMVVSDASPEALCQDITIQLNADGTICVTADQIDNGSTDDHGIVTMMLAPNSFDRDDVGENSVALTVVDASGNTATCTAIVTIKDTTVP
ncbi:MAG: hypothetical protein ACMUIM_01700 [bacterium]